jgi:hypothetical protein
MRQVSISVFKLKANMYSPPEFDFRSFHTAPYKGNSLNYIFLFLIRRYPCGVWSAVVPVVFKPLQLQVPAHLIAVDMWQVPHSFRRYVRLGA